MRKSIIYIVVLLTMFSLSCTLIPGAFSQTENIKILSYSWYIDGAGLLDAVGEVQNVGTSTVTQVILSGTATITDGGQTLSTTQVWVQDLLPQQKAPFYMTFYIQSSGQTGQTSITPTVASIALSVVQAETTTNYQYQDLKITTHQDKIGTGTDDKGVYWVTGTIQNTGSKIAQNVRVLGTFYDASGNVIAVGGYTDDILTASLSPSAKIDFKFGAYDTNETLMPSDQKIASYVLLIQAEGPILQGTAPQITPYPTSNSSPAATTSPSNTQSANSNPTESSSLTNAASAGWIYPAVIVIVIVAIIGVALVLRKRKPQQVSKATKKNK